MSHQPYRCSRKHYVFSCSSIYACMCAWLEAFSNWLGISVYLHTHTHPFSRPFSGTTQVSRYQKGKTNLDSTEARDGEWQWHPLGQMPVFTSLHTEPRHSFFTGRMPFLPPSQQCQSTEGMMSVYKCLYYELYALLTVVRCRSYTFELLQ